MGSEPQQNIQIKQMQPHPVPMELTIVLDEHIPTIVAGDNGQPHTELRPYVVLFASTAQGMTTLFFPIDEGAAEIVGQRIISLAKQGKTGLIVPNTGGFSPDEGPQVEGR